MTNSQDSVRGVDRLPEWATRHHVPRQVKISQSGNTMTIDSTFLPGFAVSGICKWPVKLSQLGTVVSINQGTYQCDFFEERRGHSDTPPSNPEPPPE